MEIKFHSQAKIQYACFFLKIMKYRNRPKEDGIAYKIYRKWLLAGWKPAVQYVTLARESQQYLRVKDTCVLS